MRTLRVAAIQVTSLNGQPERNLENAASFVAQARADGAELVLCPEFLAAGYVYDEVIWRSAEPRGGLTETWLADLARRHRIVIGATYLEADGRDFYNTFALFGPSGDALGRVRKQSLPFFEGWFFTPCPLPKVIESPLGKLGVGICNDNQTAEFLRHIAETQPDLILMPHSAPAPLLPLLKKIFEQRLRETPGNYARALGVPVVLANKVSTEITKTPIPLLPGVRVPLVFRGLSSICDSDGTELGRLEKREGAVVADVVLDPARKHEFDAPNRGYWSFPPPVLSRSSGRMLRALDALGRNAYRKNPRRATAAQARSGAH